LFLKPPQKIYDEWWKVIYMGNVQGPEKLNDTCVKTMRAGTMARGFTVFKNEMLQFNG
jgi:hypothetical protein